MTSVLFLAPNARRKDGGASSAALEWLRTQRGYEVEPTPVKSFCRYNIWPGYPATAVSYYVRATTAAGESTGLGIFATFIERHARIMRAF